ncbi:uncharacterized protein SOCE26_030330 [Sorangium cellulosum]|uniref:Uncharacterized protein n=1 Tax=Sorangium cellulosum TaxID=56 RepID=A0A2L0EQT0_SORCE|nr:hypothetical protein [Sorangium cellulosum]AUX41612.1 uncharacterized protein SOCE26_030330 [Sorangium cellulosum]
MADNDSTAGESMNILTGALQTPPDVKLTVLKGPSLIMKVVSLGAAPRGAYLQNVEYWRQAKGAVFDASDDLQLCCEKLTEDSEGKIDTVLQGCSDGFSHKRPVDMRDWHKGVRVIPQGRIGYLFSSPGPDSSNIQTCLLIEVTASANPRTMVATTWYRSTAPQPNKYQIWDKDAPFGLTMRPVKAGGQNVTDPRVIPGCAGATWHYTSMGSV